MALVICNEIIEDRHTNNKTLIGLFNAIWVSGVPVRHDRMFVMASLTDGRGEWPVSLVIRAPSGRHIFRADGVGQFRDPIAVHDLVIEIRNLPIAALGEYFVDLHCGSELLATRRFAVVQREG